MKALAINTIFMIVTTVVFLFFGFIILFGVLNIGNVQASKASCTIKLANYCSVWLSKGYSDTDKPYDWGHRSPTECSKYLEGVDDAAGPTKEKCKPIAKIS